ncbi:hypothetical protein K505DRAFT_320665 [Melanomma pulvis-pyrius CBS 109.77]|uniref:Secreted protein n=1 Tax=Melanomma pulvis-pyrius CBS 109.77 TaxID=1314802 RepID=A0A6A6XV95_9PLEO|nr:hypothetical protein K505DRAFT_320665 [Melanomma pulvis-pyrius CBS 109.77]
MSAFLSSVPPPSNLSVSLSSLVHLLVLHLLAVPLSCARSTCGRGCGCGSAWGEGRGARSLKETAPVASSTRDGVQGPAIWSLSSEFRELCGICAC